MELGKKDSALKWLAAIGVWAAINCVSYLYSPTRVADERKFFKFKIDDFFEFAVIPFILLASWYFYIKYFRAFGVNSGLLLILGMLSIPSIFFTFFLLVSYPGSFVAK